MKKHVFGRHFKRDTNERKALFKNLMNELVLHERIRTTEEKARAIRGQVERLVTKAKRKKELSRQFLQPFLSSMAVEKVIADLAPRFADRPGGYTRVLKLGSRFSDNADMAVIEWVERPVKAEIVSTPVVKGIPLRPDTAKATSGKQSSTGQAKLEKKEAVVAVEQKATKMPEKKAGKSFKARKK